MSDVQAQPAWWQASDGKWYRPEQHPDYQAPAPLPSSEETDPASDSTNGKPTYLRKWFLITAVVVAALVVAIVLRWISGI